ncbi:hypothetical protein BDZ45DRAFT_607525, partial [Acephala macrosclerotiorum]
KLKDGTVFPKGSYVSLPVSAIHNDPDTTSDSEVLDGFRCYKLREGQLHQFGTTQANILHFRYSKHACLGRFFATLEIKNIPVKFIMDYDFKFPDVEGRPVNLTTYGFVFLDLDATLLIKESSEEMKLYSVAPLIAKDFTPASEK